MSVERAEPTTTENPPNTWEVREDVELRCSIRDEDLDLELPNMKKLVGKTDAVTTDWLYSTAGYTYVVQEDLEAEINDSPPRMLVLTPKTLALWLRTKMGRCSKKRKEGGASEEEDGAELLRDNLANLMLTALVAAVLLLKGVWWLEESIEKVDERIDRLSEKDTNSAEEEEEKEKLYGVKEEMEYIQSEMDKQSVAHYDMLKAILKGDIDGVQNALQDYRFQLDIGENPTH